MMPNLSSLVAPYAVLITTSGAIIDIIVIMTIPTFQCNPISTNNVSTEYLLPYAPFDTIGVAVNNLIEGYNHWF